VFYYIQPGRWEITSAWRILPPEVQARIPNVLQNLAHAGDLAVQRLDADFLRFVWDIRCHAAEWADFQVLLYSHLDTRVFAEMRRWVQERHQKIQGSGLRVQGSRFKVMSSMPGSRD